MSSYIVRVYRREPPSEIKGVVELPELEQRSSFRSFEELKAILLAHGVVEMDSRRYELLWSQCQRSQ